MRRRRAIGLLGAGLLAGAARAQGSRHWRIGILETVSQDLNKANYEALLRGLRNRGYVEGQNLTIDYRSAQGVGERFPALARALVESAVDLIVTRGTPAARAAKQATSSIPIVMAAIGEPLGVGIVESLAHPGGNITGFSAFVTELAGKRVELLKGGFPSIARVGVLLGMANPVSPPQWAAASEVGRVLGVAVELLDIRTAADVKSAFATIDAHRIDALCCGIDVLIQAQAATIVAEANRRQMPTIYPSREFLDHGGLISYGPSYPDLYFRAAGSIDRIFKGARPGDLPIEQPSKIELVINARAAAALGLQIPSALLVRAEEIIE